MAAVFGSNNPRLAEGPPSASPYPPAPGNDSESETPVQPGSRTVLLVEDNPTDLFVIQEALERSGLNLTLRMATNGQEALRYLQDLAASEKPACPDLVLLDLNLPKVDGLAVLRYLRNTSPCRRIPVIVVTSSTAESDRAAVRRLGAEAYFHKPTDLSAYLRLTEVVQRVLNSAEGNR